MSLFCALVEGFNRVGLRVQINASATDLDAGTNLEKLEPDLAGYPKMAESLVRH
jgi:hypothetical protein